MTEQRRPSRGEIWTANLNPTVGHEQAGTRPCLIISVDQFNYGPARLVVLLPLTTTRRRIPLHIAVDPPEGGLRERSYIKTEDIRSVSLQRLMEFWGAITAGTLGAVEDRLRILLRL